MKHAFSLAGALVLGATLFPATGAFAQAATGSHAAPPAPMTAKAELRNREGELIGTALLVEESKGVRIMLSAANLPPGKHGFHIHASAHCDAPDFKSAGGHFNPDKKEHGFKNPKGPHAGDLPNLEVKRDGTAQVNVLAKGLTLHPGKYSLLEGDGTSLMIHAGPDDYKSNPAGASGDRIGCGVITR